MTSEQAWSLLVAAAWFAVYWAICRGPAKIMVREADDCPLWCTAAKHRTPKERKL